MKKFIVLVLMFMMCLPAFAQHRPGPYPRPVPHPRPVPNPYPYPGATCQVYALDRFNRVVATFWGRRDYYSGMCREGLQLCNMEVQRRGWWDVRCVQAAGRRIR